MAVIPRILLRKIGLNFGLFGAGEIYSIQGENMDNSIKFKPRALNYCWRNTYSAGFQIYIYIGTSFVGYITTLDSFIQYET
jgi:hypothetical protein